jgi:hypothetical protein
MNLSTKLIRFFKADPTVNALEALRARIASMPVRREPISGQTFSYVQRDEALGWIEEAIRKAKAE